MPTGPIDPTTLEGDDLVQWYRRSPWDIEQQRQAARRQQYIDFFGVDPGGSDNQQGSDQNVSGDQSAVQAGQSQPPQQTAFPVLSFGPDRFVPGLLGDLSGLSLPPWQAGSSSAGARPSNGIAQTDFTAGQNSASPSDPSPEGSGGDGGAALDGADAPDDSSSAQGPEGPDPSSGGVISTASAPNLSQTSEWIRRRNAQVRSVLAAAPSGRQIWAAPIGGTSRASSPRPVGPQPPSRTPSTVPGPKSASSPLDAVGNVLKKFQQGPPITPPSAMESFIPVVGPAWQAASDLQRGHYGAAAFNGALAASDLFLGGEIAKGLAKGGFYVAEDAAKEAPYAWDTVRKWMGDQGMVQPGEHGHHWLIPQNGWGKEVPEWLKNQPWNIKPLDRVTHGRVHHSWKGLPQFNPAQRYWYGTPAWSKVGAAAAVGHPIAAAEAQSDQGK